MRILGISPLDKDSTVCLLENGKIIAAIAEERLSRKKLHEGFPYLAMKEIMRQFALSPTDIDAVAYAFFDYEKETELMRSSINCYRQKQKSISNSKMFSLLKHLPSATAKIYNIQGLGEEKLYIRKPWYMELAYWASSTIPIIGAYVGHRALNRWVERASSDHQKWSTELEKGLGQFGLREKLHRFDHQLCHAANAYYTSGYDEALIVTVDGYGSGMAGSISMGKAGVIERIHKLDYPNSLGEFYERVTSSLGFKPSRHEGKIVGLAAYDDPDILYETVRSFFEVRNGDIFYRLPNNIFKDRYLASKFSKPTVAAAYQKVLESVLCEYIEYYVKKSGINSVVLSGGVAANVKTNQRIFAIKGVDKIFIYPNMGDGGCGTGAALLYHASKMGLYPFKLDNVYWGQEFSEEEMMIALKEAGLKSEKPNDLEQRVAELVAEGNIVARFNGRMEYGPRALGNRTILYHAKDPSVNLWLNQQLKRTEFMPFAPATLYEEKDRCYKNLEGAEYTSMFMTLTCDCTDFMIENCPAAVHVDGTARPQLVSSESNKSFYKILQKYHKITGIPSLINTSFNLHEEPIVCTPQDAIRAFTLGHIPYLAMGPFVVRHENNAS